ncbi:hypothetical protein A3Q56_06270 [Intoshia linei]|uniref:Uncharacterized protein n=1 Tax=Intoshia linei TaxID=1819745 RepID=A0A177AVG6_9BILA|nr:hypothetical protein A3Q56_06270 [Intoshia linei]
MSLTQLKTSFDKEILIVERLVYIDKNRHRNSTSYKRLNQIYKCVKKVNIEHIFTNNQDYETRILQFLKKMDNLLISLFINCMQNFGNEMFLQTHLVYASIASRLTRILKETMKIKKITVNTET